jgi:hypothetical protein
VGLPLLNRDRFWGGFLGNDTNERNQSECTTEAVADEGGRRAGPSGYDGKERHVVADGAYSTAARAQRTIEQGPGREFPETRPRNTYQKCFWLN